MPDVTPTLPARYRRLALTALADLMARGNRAVLGHRATVERLAATGDESASARAGLRLAERSLAVLRGRQRFLRSSDPSVTE
jgi:hypothetical protein